MSTERMNPEVMSQVEKNNALFTACRENNQAEATRFILGGADINADSGFVTPLLYAACKGRIELATLLLQHGADVNARITYYNYNTLAAAASNGHTELAQLLLQHGADVNAPNIEDDTPLHYAARNGNHLLVVQMLKAKEGKPYNEEFHAGEAAFTLCADTIIREGTNPDAFEEALNVLHNSILGKVTKAALREVPVPAPVEAASEKAQEADDAAKVALDLSMENAYDYKRTKTEDSTTQEDAVSEVIPPQYTNVQYTNVQYSGEEGDLALSLADLGLE